MVDHTLSAAILSGNGHSSHLADAPDMARSRPLALPTMVDTVDAQVRNAQAPWADFSSEKYYDHNYKIMLAEDQEIMQRVSLFFAKAFANRDRAECAIDVGSGANLYPALLMLPWTRNILLTDYSPPNVDWLDREVREESTPWPWESFWLELKAAKGYEDVEDPRRQLKKACLGDPHRAGIKRESVFTLPEDQWQLGTMFFVAESITEDLAEFRAAVGKFVSALQKDAPFAATFMAESDGYRVGTTWFPARSVTSEQVRECFEDLGVNKLTVAMTEKPAKVRDGYKGMIIATGIAGGR